jgi:excisionase family DNA binding protein
MAARWSTEEVQALEQIAIDQPPDRVYATFCRWAALHGYPPRSAWSIRGRLSRSRVTIKAEGDWVGMRYVCEVLGISYDTPHKWTERHGIPCHRNGRGARFFRRADLRQAAMERPQMFGGIAADRLFTLLEDRALVDDIAARFPRRAADPRPVRAVETGWRYPSVRAAAERVYVRRQAIQFAIRSGGTAAGYHWEFAA